MSFGSANLRNFQICIIFTGRRQDQVVLLTKTILRKPILELSLFPNNHTQKENQPSTNPRGKTRALIWKYVFVGVNYLMWRKTRAAPSFVFQVRFGDLGGAFDYSRTPPREQFRDSSAAAPMPIMGFPLRAMIRCRESTRALPVSPGLNNIAKRIGKQNGAIDILLNLPAVSPFPFIANVHTTIKRASFYAHATMLLRTTLN